MPQGRSHLVRENHNHWKGGKPKCILCGKQLANYSKIRAGKPTTGACGNCVYLIKPKTNPGGYKLSNEFKEKVRQRMIGNKYTLGMSGEKHPRWKGGMANTLILNGRRRARKLMAYGNHTLQQWLELKERYNYTCFMCHRSEPEIKLTEDHIIPLTLGGDDNIGNIQPLCKNCNSKKSNRLLIYFEPTYQLLVKGTLTC